ncbi:PLDc N-terminal domain-containing protein [Pseudobacillus badius]|uniref:PLDc N-terminal domain-containing protein n=1 Tax=Bacillus badius TaxID=1455 RepID=UPI0007B320BB|nr:PLDc N-terminal domain-containing protein [Bacillus badius]KZR57475.1 transcriptional regulator [Bacillus badius]UAT28966.1 PLDc N-terminal domain-containing protein [Bacillus badius]GLY12918.1 negative regulatory protein YxlE [Bacillus badius]
MNELLNGIPWGAIAPIFVLHLILMITALVSCIKEEKTNGSKWLWILIILIINLIGPVLYFVVGRRND